MRIKKEIHTKIDTINSKLFRLLKHAADPRYKLEPELIENLMTDFAYVVGTLNEIYSKLSIIISKSVKEKN